MRIAIVSRELPPHGGGIGSWSSKAAQGLARLGNDVHLFTERHDGEAVAETQSGVRIHRVAPVALRPRSAGWSWAVRKAVVEAGPFDVVQACEWDAEAFFYSLRPVAPLVTRLATPHYLVHRINGAGWGRGVRTSLTGRMERMQARRSRRVICPTRVLAREVAGSWGIDLRSIAVIPTGIDPPEVSPEPVPAFLAEVPYILYFGRLEVRKGVDTLIDALPEILAAHPEVHCVFIGEDLGYWGVAFPEYAAQRCAGFPGRVHFLPRLPHAKLFRIVAGAAVVALPSRWENLANTCLESMILGRAIIGTTGSGFDEVLTDGVDGLLVPPGDVSALAEATIRALGEPGLLARLGDAARRRADDFTVDGMARRLMEVYGEIAR
jgi:glycogen synthase